MPKELKLKDLSKSELIQLINMKPAFFPSQKDLALAKYLDGTERAGAIMDQAAADMKKSDEIKDWDKRQIAYHEAAIKYKKGEKLWERSNTFFDQYRTYNEDRTRNA